MDRRLLLQRLGRSVHNVSFSEFQNLVEGFGFRLLRVRGSHHIYAHPEVREPVNIQSVRGEAKAYQIRQFLSLVEAYNLKLEDET